MYRYTQKLAIALIVIAALNFGFLGLFKVNVIERLIGKTLFTRVLYILFGLAAVTMVFHRDTYLPFLGETVFPSSVLHNQTPAGATRTVVVKVKPLTKVVFWASEPGDGNSLDKKFFDLAYGNYQNAGVVQANNKGEAILKVREPQSYNVPFQTLDPHVHYRSVDSSGILGPVKTAFVKA
jgi:uncharacterized membrane protein YuzA (DUF378 family)